MNFDDYEQLPSTNVATNMTAGAIAGVLEHCVMYPLDSVKTRMQSLSPLTAGRSVYQTMRNMITSEGIFRPIRGMGAVVIGAGPAHAFYFGTYEYTKERMSGFSKNKHVHYITAATTATLIHDAISNPTEVIKQRLQMYNSPYRSVIHCTKVVFQTEGIKAFYRSYSTQLVMNLPYQAIHFSTYEFFQNMFNKDHRYNPPVHVLAGGAAGAAAAAFTTPLDVVKTLLNTQEKNTKGMFEAIMQINKLAGPLGFFKGLVPRVLYSVPATAICWSTYEFFKYILNGSKDELKNKTSILVKQPQTKDIGSIGVDKLHSADPPVGLHYTLPSTIIGADVNNDLPTTLRDTSSIKPRELPVISGAGMYGALSMNTIHSDTNKYERSCKT